MSKKLADLTDEQLERRVKKRKLSRRLKFLAKMNRRATRQQLQAQLAMLLEQGTLWGEIARPSQIRAGAKLLAARLVAYDRRNPETAAA